jgi:tetratricopeptide (TPR) repeat protein
VSQAEFHWKTARKCFNETWDYLDRKDRNTADEQQMLHLAHASCYHWSFVGDAENLAVSHWQISRAYAELKQPQLALRFARSALETCQKNNLANILHTAYEAIARAYAVADDHKSAKEYLKKAREQLDKLTLDDEDRKVYLDQIRETEELTEKYCI